MEATLATDRIEREIHINAPQERVWAVLTEADHVAAWFGDSAKVDLRPGGKMIFGWAQHGDHHATVERVDPPGFFSYRWARQPGTEPAAGNSTLVEFTLTLSGSGTTLRVVETGFAGLDVSEEEQGTAVKENTEGWATELGELQEYAERLPA
jgi:uncharacterized protein YndB with AHSA1/START domain